MEIHLKRGDVHLARRLLDVLEPGELYGVPVPEPVQLSQLRRTVDDSGSEWQGRLSTRLERASALLAQIRAQNLCRPSRSGPCPGASWTSAVVTPSGTGRASRPPRP
ncbi:hypothetical protein WKI68_34655 [Streptomyces sp. MS1.HAVA.3]|uniref:Uncharacterized protein n=1 Tax=Streptomyces caledonius TaxID=3134107 RepID=A0ABU8UCY8_9ACTN